MAGNTSGGGHGGTLAAWIAAAVIMGGTIVGGIALIEWNWPMFWVGVGLFVAGCIGARGAHIMDAVSAYGDQ